MLGSLVLCSLLDERSALRLLDQRLMFVKSTGYLDVGSTIEHVSATLEQIPVTVALKHELLKQKVFSRANKYIRTVSS